MCKNIALELSELNMREVKLSKTDSTFISMRQRSRNQLKGAISKSIWYFGAKQNGFECSKIYSRKKVRGTVTFTIYICNWWIINEFVHRIRNNMMHCALFLKLTITLGTHTHTVRACIYVCNACVYIAFIYKLF